MVAKKIIRRTPALVYHAGIRCNGHCTAIYAAVPKTLPSILDMLIIGLLCFASASQHLEQNFPRPHFCRTMGRLDNSELWSPAKYEFGHGHLQTPWSWNVHRGIQRENQQLFHCLP